MEPNSLAEQAKSKGLPFLYLRVAHPALPVAFWDYGRHLCSYTSCTLVKLFLLEGALLRPLVLGKLMVFCKPGFQSPLFYECRE